MNLLRINNPNIKYKIHSAGQIAQDQAPIILLNYKNIIEILGPTQSKQNLESVYIAVNEITSYLERLNFDFDFKSEISQWKVSIPISRMDDLTREIDLIEEIGRLHGFNNFVSCLPDVKTIGLEDFSC